MASPPKALESRDLYTVGWIAALPLERAAATAMLDEKHEKPADFVQPHTDKNSYTWGRIGEHNVVIASLAAGVYGTTSAAATALPMLSSFPQIRIGLLVGIGAGIARLDQDRDIRLGDIAVSQPHGNGGGVIQYDLVKAKSGNQRESRAFLNRPPEVLLKALANLQAQHELEGSKVLEYLEEATRRYPRLAKQGYVHQGFENDRLFKTTDANEEIPRKERDSTEPEIHYGIIASGNTLFKDAAHRDEILKDVGEECICFEMEAAGLMNNFPCIVVRGICDYADSHKSDRWQRYAAATAAAYAKELLGYVPSQVAGKVADIHSTITATRTTVDRLNLDSQSNKINDWLCPPNPSTNFNKAIAERQEGTGSWFLESEPFKEWKSGTRRYLWLHGIPGCGKTVLCSTIIEHLRQNQDSPHVVLDFFFDFRDAEKQSLENLVRSFVAQLYSRCENSRKELDTLFSQCEDGRRQPTTESLVTTFQHMMNYVKEIQVVIDALDECKTRRDLLLWMEQFSNSKNTNFQLLATSRAEAEIESELKRWLHQDNFVSIQQDPVNSDIRAYVHKRLREDREFERWRSAPSVQDKIETELMKKADGMFRWAACQLDSLEKCLHLGALEKALASLPKTLDETYSRILANISQETEYKEDAIRILQFLTFSERPLTIEEAVDAIAVNPSGDPQFDPSHRMPIPREIMKICSSLVFLATRELNPGGRKAMIELQLAHFSVKEYLMSRRVQETFQESMTEISARRSITRVCLSYLSHLDDTRPVEEIKAKFPLAQYSAKYWMVHAKPAETEEDVQESILKFFLQQGQAYTVWGKLFNPDLPWHENPEQDGNMASPLYYASLAGLGHTVKSLLEKGANINAQGGDFGNALQAASAGGYEQIVQLLLDKGANINAQGGRYGNALQATSARGDEKIVQLLLDKRANVNAQSGHYTEDYKKIVQLLLDKETNINTALFEGHEKIVQLLLDKRTNINVQSRHYAKDHKKIVQLLLDKRASINVQGGDYSNALQAASFKSYKKIVQLLLDKGANINTQGRAASAGDDEKIVQLLLDKGANINAQGGYYTNGNKKIVQLLLDKGANVNATSFEGHEKIVQLLLDKGTNINTQSGDFGNVLQATSFNGNKKIAALVRDYEKIVQLLLDKGANINAQAGRYGNALQAASANGNEKIVQLLLDKGVNINAQGGHYGNALQAASANGYEKIVQLLLDKGAYLSSK
ncbi:Pfs, NACHT and ankyrin domain protein [Xylogone sp. PMI_703]|nr:Pfs, NACHT and ankyrin domain protein [Xylogone sp. PMI_703]